MKSIVGVSASDVNSVYEGAEGELFELVFGEQIHIGGLASSRDLAERAGIAAGQHGVDLCCCNGAGMRFLVRFCDVASVIGVDATARIVERGRERCDEAGLAQSIRFIHADACDSGLPDAEADFVWGEDAWCYVADKPGLISEAARIVRPGGVIAFTDWVEGAAGLSDGEAELVLGGMRFDNIEGLAGYRALLEESGCDVLEASETGRFARHFDLYADMIEMQLTWDALKIVGFDSSRVDLLITGFRLFAGLAHQGKLAQGRFIARKR
ncbi:MAG: methyltransferase domain-containing protein [Deltaproteobacteria bacterium]|nr:methyltransferase domain-containing protein [Deltaproteobacteria bacterium]MBW2696175.1 methyltransferase domain-containing protein [Deltaproteobacteria bacterium]